MGRFHCQYCQSCNYKSLGAVRFHFETFVIFVTNTAYCENNNSVNAFLLSCPRYWFAIALATNNPVFPRSQTSCGLGMPSLPWNSVPLIPSCFARGLLIATAH